MLVDMQAAAESAARQAEVHAWKTKGAAVKVQGAGGRGCGGKGCRERR